MELIDLRAPFPCLGSGDRVRQFLAQHDLVQESEGCYEIDGRNFFVNVFSYETATAAQRIWEAHQDYIDVHYLFTAEEGINHAFLADCRRGDYVSERDFLPVTPPETVSQFIFRPQQLAVFYPQDAHQTGIIVGNSKKLRKAVFKIKIHRNADNR